MLVLGAGHAGLLAAAAARAAVGPEGRVTAVDASAEALGRAAAALPATTAIRHDATDAVGVLEALRLHDLPRADLTLVCTSVPGCEGTAILATDEAGAVLFFSTATSFPAAALGADSVSSRTRLVIPNGYTDDRGSYALDLLRGSRPLRDAFEGRPGMSELPRVAYAEHTWPELRDLAARDDVVVVIPTATLEDHGHHLPIDTDVRLVEAIAGGGVRAFNEQGEAKAMLFPTAVHGFTPHHMDFPGTITLRWDVFVETLLDCGRSLCRHGFDRILIVNGHGSNAPLVDIAARQLGVEHREAVCMASTLYLSSPESAARAGRAPDERARGHVACLRAGDVAVSEAPSGPRPDGQGGARGARTGTRTSGTTGPAAGRCRTGRTGARSRSRA